MSDLDWDLIERYLAGQCGEAEQLAFERWLGAAAGRRELLTELRAAAREPRTVPSALLRRKDALWARLEREIGAMTPATSAPPPSAMAVDRAAARFTVPTRPRWAMPLKIAAAILLILGGAVAGRLVVRSHGGDRTDVVIRTVRAPTAQRASFQLPDGSQVMLGPASTLRHPATFGRESREVTLEGEAYFDVTHDEQRPFVVRAGDVVAKDLGTEFIVRAYPEDGHARVVVRAGKVALRSAAAPATARARVLVPGQLGRLSRAGEPIAEPGDTASWFAWTRGWLVFDGVPLRDAIPQLSRWYDLDFRLADSSLGDRSLIATLRSQPTDDALDVIALALGLRQVRRGRVVTFYPASAGR